MEDIYDLLGPRNGVSPAVFHAMQAVSREADYPAYAQTIKKLDVRTNAAGDNVIPDLSIRYISTLTEFEKLYR